MRRVNPLVVGFVAHGDPLLASSFVPLGDGLTVFYGLNGAGKTRFVSGISAALRGVRSRTGQVHLLVRVPRPTIDDERAETTQYDVMIPRPEWELLRHIARNHVAEAAADGETWDSRSGVFRKVHTLSAADRIYLQAVEDAADPHRGPDPAISDVFNVLVATAKEQRLLLMTPLGSVDHPRWDARFVVTEDGGPISAELNRLDIAWGADDIDAFDASPFAGLDGLERTLGLISPGIDTNAPVQSIPGPIDLGIDVLDITEDPNAITAQLLGSWTVSNLAERPQFRDSRIDQADFEDANRMEAEAYERAVDHVIDLLRTRAQQSLDTALLDAPYIRPELARGRDRFEEPPVRWTARRHFAPFDHGIGTGIDRLSRAEQSWVHYAIADAVYWVSREINVDPVSPLRPLMTIIDEPEAALHRAAESHMAMMLVHRSQESNRRFIVATHSPDMLDAPGSHLFHIKSNADKYAHSSVQPLAAEDEAALKDLGLRPSDLLRWPRIFLLVEGLHDEVVLNAYFGRRLSRARVQILPLRGASKLPNTVDSRVLFDFTDAHLVALLDNENADALSKTWHAAQSTRETGSIEEAQGVVVNGITGQSDEARWLREWLTAALAKGLDGRISPYALAAKDVIEYLPVGRIVPSGASWQALRAQHADLRDSTRSTPKDFKAWLQQDLGATVTPESLIAAAQAAEVPKELELMVAHLEALASEPRS